MYICNLIKNLQLAMSMQQIMRWGHDFLRIRWGECLTLIHWGKSMFQKKTPKNVCPFPHAFTFSSSHTFWGASDVLIIHYSFTHDFFLLPHTAEPSKIFYASCFHCFLIMHAQSIIWLSPKCCGPF